ncbi:hypothetical protein SUGI_0080050 [Cryptomeria japonica]|nr:hypothetical protein SUGI_0080050 [Cryptomeria japonica]
MQNFLTVRSPFVILAFHSFVSHFPRSALFPSLKYLGENRAFTPTQILAMILSNLKQIAKDNLKTVIVDCCIGIPVYFTDLERRVVLDVASIVNLTPCFMLHVGTNSMFYVHSFSR